MRYKIQIITIHHIFKNINCSEYPHSSSGEGEGSKWIN